MQDWKKAESLKEALSWSRSSISRLWFIIRERRWLIPNCKQSRAHISASGAVSSRTRFLENSHLLTCGCPLSRWCHPAISSSIIPLSSHLKSFPAPGSSLMSQFFTSGGQSVGVSALTSLLPVNIQDWFPLGWTGCTSLQSKRLSRVSPTPQLKGINSSALSFLYSPTVTSIRDHRKNHSFN